MPEVDPVAQRIRRVDRIAAALLLLTALVCAGCSSYSAVISLDETGGVPAPPSPADIARASSAIRKAVEHLGMIEDPRLQRIAEESRSSSSVDNVVVDLLKMGPERSEFVEVRLVIEKRTGAFLVVIRDYELPVASDLTRELEGAVVSPLQNEFPDRAIRVDRGTRGPELGP